MNKTARPIGIVLAFVLSVTMGRQALGQHLGDVEIHLDDNRLFTEDAGGQSRVYVNEFDDVGGTLFTDEPGFESQTGALPAGMPIGFNVLQSLWYWDGEQLASPAANASITMSLDSASPVFITSLSGPQPGFTIATASSSGTIHTHLSYTLSPGDVPLGVYGIVLELASPTVESSLPLLLAFNHGLDDVAQIEAGAAAIELAAGIAEPVGVPGDTDGDGDVDLEDLNNVRNHFGELGDPVLGDTLPFDGVVDLIDLNQVRNDFGASASTRSVPEPATSMLVGVACLALSSRRVRRHLAGRR